MSEIVPDITIERRKLNGALGVARRLNWPNEPEIRNALVVARIKECAYKIASEAPPLTPAQRDEIANILQAEIAEIVGQVHVEHRCAGCGARPPKEQEMPEGGWPELCRACRSAAAGE